MKQLCTSIIPPYQSPARDADLQHILRFSPERTGTVSVCNPTCYTACRNIQHRPTRRSGHFQRDSPWTDSQELRKLEPDLLPNTVTISPSYQLNRADTAFQKPKVFSALTLSAIIWWRTWTFMDHQKYGRSFVGKQRNFTGISGRFIQSICKSWTLSLKWEDWSRCQEAARLWHQGHLLVIKISWRNFDNLYWLLQR